jgi:DNA-binding response OmpR family regulator
MLTALSSTQDKVKGLDSGADDYLPKPFALEELKARVRALLRRYGGSNSASFLKFADLEMDLVTRKVSRAGQELKLTSKEFALLEYFMRHVGRPVSRMEILEHVWDMSFDPGSNVVDVYVNMLRKKIDLPFKHKIIHTVVGFGYEFRA